MRTRRVCIAIAVALPVAAAAAACSVEDVLVAQDVADNGTGGGPCSDSRDCSPVAFCSKTSCTAARGHCVARPMDCPEPKDPYCDCNGVNYWNDCVRQQNGVSFSTQGECSAPYVACGGFRGPACPPGAHCARLAAPGENCDPGTQGVCWVLPPRCPPDDGGSNWESCGVFPPICSDFCKAILYERPARASSSSSTCP
jgi:hypothetical protein